MPSFWEKQQATGGVATITQPKPLEPWEVVDGYNSLTSPLAPPIDAEPSAAPPPTEPIPIAPDQPPTEGPVLPAPPPLRVPNAPVIPSYMQIQQPEPLKSTDELRGYDPTDAELKAAEGKYIPGFTERLVLQKYPPDVQKELEPLLPPTQKPIPFSVQKEFGGLIAQVLDGMMQTAAAPGAVIGAVGEALPAQEQRTTIDYVWNFVTEPLSGFLSLGHQFTMGGAEGQKGLQRLRDSLGDVPKDANPAQAFLALGNALYLRPADFWTGFYHEAVNPLNYIGPGEIAFGGRAVAALPAAARGVGATLGNALKTAAKSRRLSPEVRLAFIAEADRLSVGPGAAAAVPDDIAAFAERWRAGDATFKDGNFYEGTKVSKLDKTLKERFGDPDNFDQFVTQQPTTALRPRFNADRDPLLLQNMNPEALKAEFIGIPKTVVVRPGKSIRNDLYPELSTTALPKHAQAGWVMHDVFSRLENPRVFATDADLATYLNSRGGFDKAAAELRKAGFDSIYVPESRNGGGRIFVLEKGKIASPYTPTTLTDDMINALKEQSAREAARAAEPNVAADVVPRPRTIPEPNAADNVAAGEVPPVDGGVGGGEPPKPPAPPDSEDALRERRFAGSVRTAPQTAEALARDIEDSSVTKYFPITNKATIEEATAFIEAEPQAARNLIHREGSIDAITSAVGQVLIQRANAARDFDEALRLVEALAERATTAGQFIQAFAMYSRLTPEGTLRFAESVVRRSGSEAARKKFTPEKAKELVDLATALQGMPEGRDKVLTTAELVRNVHELVPPSKLRQISTLQTMAQLLNPKTWIRNLGGNAIFLGFENLSRLVAVAADLPVSAITGERSRALVGLGAQVAGGKKGFKEGLEEALRGVQTIEAPSQFGLPNAPVFRNTPVLGGLEKALNIELRVPDRAFYQAAFEDSVHMQARVVALNEGLHGPELAARELNLLGNPTEAMLKQAHLDGLYRTFQDDNWFAQVGIDFKRLLNFRQDFGVGDLILKYPRTPATLLARALEYSPVGYMHTMGELITPLFRKKFDQGVFVDSFARATVGTAGLTATGVALADVGILSGKSVEDRDTTAVERETGRGAYRVNVDALRRYISSGLDRESANAVSGDKYVSYDWAQPMSVSLAIGASIAEPQKETRERVSRRPQGETIFDTFSKIVTSGTDALLLGMDTLAEQPLLQGVRQVFGGYDALDSLINVLVQAPASFVPTLLSQINQWSDNARRVTYSPEMWERGLNAILAKIPVLAATLPQQESVWGEPQDRYLNDTNNPFNVFVNPAFVTDYLPSPEAKMLLDLFERTGQTSQMPRVVPRSITIDGKIYPLTTEEVVRYQHLMGRMTREAFSALVGNTDFRNEEPEEQVKQLQGILTSINGALIEAMRDGKGIMASSPNMVPLPPNPTPTPTPTKPTPTSTPPAKFAPQPSPQATARADYALDAAGIQAGQAWKRTNPNGSPMSYEQFSVAEKAVIRQQVLRWNDLTIKYYGSAGYQEWRELPPDYRNIIIRRAGRFPAPPLPTPTPTPTRQQYFRELVPAEAR